MLSPHHLCEWQMKMQAKCQPVLVDSPFLVLFICLFCFVVVLHCVFSIYVFVLAWFGLDCYGAFWINKRIIQTQSSLLPWNFSSPGPCWKALTSSRSELSSNKPRKSLQGIWITTEGSTAPLQPIPHPVPLCVWNSDISF